MTPTTCDLDGRTKVYVDGSFIATTFQYHAASRRPNNQPPPGKNAVDKKNCPQTRRKRPKHAPKHQPLESTPMHEMS